MSTPTYELLNTVELATTTGAVLFSNIPQNFASLVVDLRGSATAINNQYQLRLNSVSGASLIYLDSQGSSLFYGSAPQASMWWNPAGSDVISRNFVIDYNDSNKTKVIITRAFSNGGPLSFYASRFDSTSPVTSLQIFNNSGFLAAGTVIDVFGVRG